MYITYVCTSSCVDQFDVYYVTFLLDTIESSAADSSMEEIADGFLNLLLSFNQHFGGKQLSIGLNIYTFPLLTDPANNLVMNSLMKQPNRKVFGEKLILLVNREGTSIRIIYVYYITTYRGSSGNQGAKCTKFIN